MWELRDLSPVSIGGLKMSVFIHVSAAHKESLCKNIFKMKKTMLRSDHKFESKSGYPTFWNHIIDSVKYRDDHLEVPKVT